MNVKFRVLDRTGDSEITFNSADEAVAKFNELCRTAGKFAHIPAARTGGAGTHLPADAPDLRERIVNAEEVIFSPQIIGG